MPKTTIQHDGEEVQIRVWVPAEMYAQIAIRSEESGVSKAAITRDLMLAGLQAEQRNARELDHLERLVYFAAVESARTAEGIDDATRGSGAEPEAIAEMLAERKMRAIAKIRKILRNPNPMDYERDD